MITSTKQVTGDTDSARATANDINAPGDQVRVDLYPGKASANLHSPGVLVDYYLLKSGHRDVHTRGGRESVIKGVTTAFDRKWCAC